VRVAGTDFIDKNGQQQIWIEEAMLMLNRPMLLF